MGGTRARKKKKNWSTNPSSDAADQAQIVSSSKIIRTLIVRASQAACGVQVTEVPLESRRRLPTRRSGRAAGGAGGSASADVGLPELAQLLAQLLPRCCPIGLDAVPQLRHVALEVQLVLLQPRHVQLLARRAPLKLPLDVLVVVADDPTGGMRIMLSSSTAHRNFARGDTYFVIMPVVLRPSVRCVTRNLPSFLIGA